MSEYRILAGGDLFPRKCLELYSAGDPGKLFDTEILELFRRADLRVLNLEGALTDSEKKTPKCGPSIKAPGSTAAAIKALGVDYLSLANNHVMDYGAEGYSDTCRILEENGIGYFGAGESISSVSPSVTVRAKGKTVTIYAVSETVFNIPGEDSPGANLYDEYRVCNELKELKPECDLLIVLYHGGVEYFRYPTPWIRSRFHRMADCGADIILGQHSHCIGTPENYNGCWMLYGQGNFHFIQGNEPELTRSGLLLEIVLGDKGFEVKPHLTYLDGYRAVYDKKQDLADLWERGRRLESGDQFEKEFSEYCGKWMIKWLLEFRGLTFKDKVFRKLLSQEKFIQYLRKSYSNHTVLRMLEHVRGEEDVEVMQQGLADFYGRG